MCRVCCGDVLVVPWYGLRVIYVVCCCVLQCVVVVCVVVCCYGMLCLVCHSSIGIELVVYGVGWWLIGVASVW